MTKLHSYITLLILSLSGCLYAQHTITGRIVEENTNTPVPYAAISLVEQGLWTISNPDGTFAITQVREGKISLKVSCLGFVNFSMSFEHISDLPKNYTIHLKHNNLQLEEVVVTAEKKSNALTTSYVVDKNAMNHIQSSSVTDIMSQLPGATTNSQQDLTSDQKVAIRANTKSDLDHSSFGTAVEVDGIRLSNNSNFDENSSSSISGIVINNISTSNIESIEIVTGLPSVEFGDLSSGLVSIKTKKGRTPFNFEAIIKPKIKSYALQKGFDLRNNGGTFNISLEHTSSIDERSSPFTTYTRNNLNLVYEREFSLAHKPLVMTSTLAGNIGGLDNASDPDLFVNTYNKRSDNTVRGGVNFEYLLNLPWITNLEVKASVNYSNKEKEINKKFDSSSSTALNRSTESGYYIGVDYDSNPDAPLVVVPKTSSAYITQFFDNQPINYALSAKAQWCKTVKSTNNNLTIGGQYTYSGNHGRGEYFGDMQYTSISYREFRYNEQPFINNIALYAEEKVTFPLFERELQIQAGIRNDNTIINNSAYGTVSSFSPRLNMKYQIIKNKTKTIKKLSAHGSIGDAVKLPSSNVLYPRPRYIDQLIFGGASDSENMSYPAHYTQVSQSIYNPNLSYQRVRKAEIGIDIKTNLASISLTAYQDKTFDPYKSTKLHSPYTYNQPTVDALENCNIPSEDRTYSINQNTGLITVGDRTGILPDHPLEHDSKTTYLSNYFYTNGSSDVVKQGLEWVIRFNKIKALNTSVRLDGTYAYYKGIDESIEQSLYSGKGADQKPYKYIGYYIGSGSVSNGQISKNVNTNLTFITHIPQMRLIMTMRIEASLYNTTQYLSEYSATSRSYVIDQQTDNIASETKTDIYAGDQYIATAPLYYTSYNDPDTHIPFYDKLLWAKENDINLYKDLVKMIKKSNSNYYFNERRLSPYFSANLNITKEIGDRVSLSFLANNFFNNMSQIKDYQRDRNVSLYHSNYIPQLYYGLSLRVKL